MDPRRGFAMRTRARDLMHAIANRSAGSLSDVFTFDRYRVKIMRNNPAPILIEFCADVTPNNLMIQSMF